VWVLGGVGVSWWVVSERTTELESEIRCRRGGRNDKYILKTRRIYSLDPSVSLLFKFNSHISIAYTGISSGKHKEGHIK